MGGLFGRGLGSPLDAPLLTPAQCLFLQGPRSAVASRKEELNEFQQRMQVRAEGRGVLWAYEAW